MLLSMKLFQLMNIFILALIAPAAALDCRSIELCVIRTFNIPQHDNCLLFCNEESMTDYLGQRLITNDPCQGADGFSVFTTAFADEPCVTACGGKGQTCVCKACTTAFRVRKDNVFTPKSLSCQYQAYIARVTNLRYLGPTDKAFGAYALGAVQNDDVHCGHH